MRFRDVGVQLEYDGDFKIYREDGISRYGKPDYLFLYFHTECCVVLDKQPIYVKPPSVILYDIGAKQHYYAVNDSYKDDFVHFWLDDSRSFVDEINLPMNTVIHLPENTLIPSMMKQLYQEYISMNEYKETTMECLFKMILIKVSEMSERRKVAKIPDRYDELFQNLRSQVYLEPSKDWHVSECAGDNGLSTPYFQKLYKSYFGNTFVQDVVQSRMEHAKHFLLVSNYSIKEIADLCGYHNETFFMKQFKKNIHVTPSQYRAQARKKLQE